ncbi:hypothetical protein KBA63_00265 [Candidatus Woesebacteria bacterium]|nr:hypothetical protein [Candidatus Woesebacteria bacterium]MBP7118499.1 hypothetical protein [Candidatus Woesebacteria bacterium]
MQKYVRKPSPTKEKCYADYVRYGIETKQFEADTVIFYSKNVVKPRYPVMEAPN